MIWSQLKTYLVVSVFCGKNTITLHITLFTINVERDRYRERQRETETERDRVIHNILMEQEIHIRLETK
jgi:hypothetical protein